MEIGIFSEKDDINECRLLAIIHTITISIGTH